MPYILCAFIGKAASLWQQATQLPEAHIVALPHEFALLPLSEAVTQPFEPASYVEPLWFLPTELCKLAAKLSATGPLGYFEIEMFGGTGGRSAVLWHNQQVVFGPVTSTTTAATEQLFELLGVTITQTHDRFDALDLGRHRYIEQWLEDQ